MDSSIRSTGTTTRANTISSKWFATFMCGQELSSLVVIIHNTQKWDWKLPILILGHTLRAKTGQFRRRSQVCQLKRQSAMNNEKDHCLYCFYYFYFYNNSEAGE